MSTKPGKLFVVATPIGNLDDISARARNVLGAVAVIAAEDTRHSGRLLQHLGITTPMVALHDFNERTASGALVQRLLRGDDVALISDAGTPLINDPGHHVVDAAHAGGIDVIAVPGPSALTAALSVCGLPLHRFAYEGYLPERPAARRALLQELAQEPRTLVFLEAPHRIVAALDDLAATFGVARRATIARELTKRFETVHRAELSGLCAWLRADPDRCRGEFVIVVEGAASPPAPEERDVRRLLAVLTRHLPVKDAAAVAAELTGRGRRELYKLALSLRAPEQ